MSDDDKRPDWKKGYELVKSFFKDSKKNSTQLDFSDRATNGKEMIVRNSKQTWKELQGVIGRMGMNHNAALISMRTYLKHRVYVYPTIKKRIFLFTVLTMGLIIRTRPYRMNIIHRWFGFCILNKILIPDIDMHKKRLSMEFNQNIKFILKFLE